ncbi:MAG: glycosyltransferase family 1 protein, partial [Thermomicrobiales bacterium]
LSFEPTYRQAGVSRYTEALARELPLVGPDEEYVIFTGPRRPSAARGIDPGIEWVHARLPTARPEARILWEQTVGATIARRYRLDLIHAPVNVTPLVTGSPRVVTIHDLAFHLYPEQYPGPKQRYLRLMTRLSVRRAARVIAVSEATRQDVIRLYGARPEMVVMVPNGVTDDYRPLPAEQVEAFRATQGLPERFILFVGTLQPRKNLETLLRAYAQVADETGWELVVAGAAGWSYAPIFETARALGLAERVRFAGYVAGEDLPLWYNAAGMFVYPALYEGFGLPLLEAMACGTPVIAANTSSLPEVVGEAGLLVDPRDVAALADAIRRLAGSETLRAELGERGRQQATAYSWRRTAEETLAVYRDVMRDA